MPNMPNTPTTSITNITTTATSEGATGRPSATDTLPGPGPAIAAAVYVTAWIIGLTAFGAGPVAGADDTTLARWYAAHRLGSAVQAGLVHGVAAVALAAWFVGLRRAGRSTPLTHGAGLLAVGISLVQLALDLPRSLWALGSSTAGLVHLIDRIDGLKMLALAVAIAGSLAVYRRTGMIGTTMQAMGVVTAAALVASGVAYLAVAGGVVAAAAVSLVLLLVWVGRIGWAASRPAR